MQYICVLVLVTERKGNLYLLRMLVGVMAMLLALAITGRAHADWIPTNVGNGADAEVRESAPGNTRGTSDELATRVRNHESPPAPEDGFDRNSLIYVRFDLSTTPIPPSFETAFRLTFRNNNLAEQRLVDLVTPDPSNRTGLAIYGLDPAALVGDWDEATITYNNAPGLTPDGDVGTRDLNSDLTFLGTVLYPDIGNQNHLPVGGELIFQSPALDQFVVDALGGGATEVTLVAHALHEGDSPVTGWINFNYLFNPKEKTTLNTDANYDADTTDPGNPLGSPWSGADNSAGDFSPSLLIQETPPDPGSITVIKQAQGDDGTFGFVSPQLGGFTIETMGGDGSRVFDNLPPGTYEITESVPAGWTLAALSCDNADSSTDLASGTATIVVTANDIQVSCIFTNRRETVVMEPAVIPALSRPALAVLVLLLALAALVVPRRARV